MDETVKVSMGGSEAGTSGVYLCITIRSDILH
jgi:hypothetical protein